ncbi:unnamed protein product [Lathyrus oleraceus]
MCKHTYVKLKGKGNAEETDVGDFQEDDVVGVEQDEVGNDVGGVENVEVGNDVGGVEQVEKGNVGGVEQVEEADGLSFNDSGDERALGLDDYFDVIENQVEEKEEKKGRIKLAARKHKHTQKKVLIGVDNVGVSSGMDNEMEINYASDELGSNDHNASDREKEPKYLRFKMQDLDKNYKLKVGLKFVSLEEFKGSITEWSILNGRQIKYVKMTKLE